MKEAFRRLWTIQVFLALFLAANPVAADGTTAVALGSPVTGTISAPDEVDWYSVTTDVVGDLTVTQTAWPPYIDTRIAIFGPNSQAPQQGNPVAAAAPGTYYIKVWSATNGSSTDPYTFTATLAKAATGNDIDGGKNSATGAVPIVLGAVVSDTIAPSKETAGAQDIDWFTLTTDVIGDLTVTQTAWPPYIETRIAIFGPNDATLQQGNPVTAAAPGTYFIKVWSATDGSSIAPYTFTTSLDKAQTGNDIDKGRNSASGAVPIVLGVPVSDTIAPSKETAGTQDVDWFALTTTVVGDLTVTQTAWPPYIETRIAIFGPNSDTIQQANPVVAAAPGTYYLKVWSYTDGSSIAPYTFVVNQAGVAADAGTVLGPPDAAVPDAAKPGDSAGADSGRSDAGSADAARSADGAGADSGKSDAGPTDGAMSADSAGADSGKPDAGPADVATASDGSASAPADAAVSPGRNTDSGSTGTGGSSGSSGSGGGCITAGQTSRSGWAGLLLAGLALALVRRRSKPRI
jgi:hypothetical protein